VTVGVLLAAGAGSRFGGDKLLAPLRGQPLVLHAINALRPAVSHIIAVVRPGSDQLTALLTQAGVQVAICEQAADGMGLSLACAARLAPTDANLLVALGDMPAVRPGTIERVTAALAAGAAIAVPSHGGRRGHPVGFAAWLVPALQALTGDQGARGLLREHAQAVLDIPVDDPGVLVDVDTRADLDRAGSVFSVDCQGNAE
jgi:molybdenum cofactor cytidylyltransferase